MKAKRARCEILMMAIFLMSFFLMAISAILFSGCKCAYEMITGYAEVRIRLPEVHPQLERIFPGCAPSWTVRWYDRGGNAHTVSTTENEVSVTLETGVFTPIIAVPSNGSAPLPADCFPAAGAIYPCHAETGSGGITLDANRLRGISAVCAERLMLSASDGIGTGARIASAFNWERFEATIGAFSHPQRLNRDKFVHAVLSGTVRIWDIKELEACEVTVSIPLAVLQTSTDGGTLTSCIPGDEPAIPDGSGRYSLVLTDGIYRYFGTQGFLTIQNTGGKTLCSVFTYYSLP